MKQIGGKLVYVPKVCDRAKRRDYGNANKQNCPAVKYHIDPLTGIYKWTCPHCGEHLVSSKIEPDELNFFHCEKTQKAYKVRSNNLNKENSNATRLLGLTRRTGKKPLIKESQPEQSGISINQTKEQEHES
jgi:predicted RNA-binding Zn-ribbon protein involved in translation (DUF1610 family)